MDGKSSGVSEKSAPRQESPPKNSSGVESSIQPTADPIRNKCREMIQNSLTVGPEKYSSQMVSLMAAKVEGFCTCAPFGPTVVKKKFRGDL